ncbi:MAG: hypothetical protein HY985_16440 [Magnetospirillum sp.]|nr:hypothetical protein [Magnetospirillum sp.]
MTAAAPPPKAAARMPVAGPACCETVSATLIGHFSTRLEVEAAKAGGSLSAAAIRALAERFLAEERARFGPLFQRSFDACTEARASRQFEMARRRPFDRILMKRFAHLFPPRPGDDGGRGILSRRVIAGFNLAVDKMIGPMLYEQCQRKCEGILERHRVGSGFDWERIYADPEAHALANDVLVVVSHYFANFHKRREWFMALVNSHLAAATAGAEDERWQLTESGFAELMHALFADLRAAMVTKPQAVKNRYGDHTFESLAEFFRRLEGS